MRIVEILPNLSSGGGERFVVDLCNELSRENDVTLILLYDTDKYNAYLDEILPEVKIRTLGKHKGLDIRIFFRLRKVIRKINPDVVHTHLAGIVYSTLLWLPNKFPVFHTVHSAADKEGIGFIPKFVRRIAFRFNLVHPVTISEESMSSFEKYYGRKAAMIYNGRPPYDPNPQEFDAVQEEIRRVRADMSSIALVNIARLSSAKNQLAMCKAIKSLVDGGANIELFIIGNVLEPDIERDIMALDCERIHLLGEKKQPRYYLKCADAFTLASFYEGMPISLIECFSVGKIPLCTPAGGIVNMLSDGQNGFLAKSSGISDIKEMYERFLSLSPSERLQMEEKSYKSYLKFSMSKCAENYVSFFKKVIRG